jgi:hypothetical protein
MDASIRRFNALLFTLGFFSTDDDNDGVHAARYKAEQHASPHALLAGK